MFQVDLQDKLRPYLQDMKPLPSVYYPEFIAANQSERANNVCNTGSKQKDLEIIRKDIRDFKVLYVHNWMFSSAGLNAAHGF